MMQQDLFSSLPPGFPMGLGGVMPPFPPFLQPQMPNMQQMMMGFDLNAPLFQPRPQLYDTHVPLVPNPKPRKNRLNQKDKNYNNNKNQNQKNNQQNNQQNNQNQNKLQGIKENGAAAAKKKEELDDLAMLGIDASDVGAGI